MLPKPAPSALRPPPARQRYSTQASECGGHGHSKAPATRPQPCLCLWVGAGSTPPPGPGCACPQPRPQRWDWAARSPRLPGACLPAWPILSLCWGETPQPPSSQTPGNLCSRPPWPGVRPAGVPTAPPPRLRWGAAALWRCLGAPYRAPGRGGDPSGPHLSLQGQQQGSNPQEGHPSHVPGAGARGQDGRGCRDSTREWVGPGHQGGARAAVWLTHEGHREQGG